MLAVGLAEREAVCSSEERGTKFFGRLSLLRESWTELKEAALASQSSQVLQQNNLLLSRLKLPSVSQHQTNWSGGLEAFISRVCI
jgi:hypothetical protein